MRGEGRRERDERRRGGESEAGGWREGRGAGGRSREGGGGKEERRRGGRIATVGGRKVCEREGGDEGVK